MKKNKRLILLISLLIIAFSFSGCGQKNSQAANNFNNDSEITVVARDAASGTRGAFHEIMKIKVKEGDSEVDKLVVGALEFDGTDKVITAVEGDKYAIGYISLGSLSDRIQAAKIDDVEPTVENVKSGQYKVARPFLLVTKGKENDLVKDFIAFTESKQGQDIVVENKFIGVIDEPAEYKSSGMSGIIKVAGSTSVTPIMEKLQEAYSEFNPDVKFEMQSNGSSQGIKAAIDGSYDIGMSSRELKEDERSQLNEHILAIDGIAVILNKVNPISNLDAKNVTAIFKGDITKWSDAE